MKKVNVELAAPVMYAGGGGVETEGSFIELSAPTGKIATLVGILKVEVGAATKKSFEGVDLSDAGSDKAAPETTPEEDGDTLFSVLTMGGADMPRVFTTFKEILRETALIAAEKPLTSPMYDRMAYNDVEKALKSYLGHFIAASA